MDYTERLSKHMMLGELLFDAHKRDNPEPGTLTTENMDEVRALCAGLLEPIIARYGPISIAAGYSDTGGAHGWTRHRGAAVDVIPHDWVNMEEAPFEMVLDMIRTDVKFERMITYGGSEVICMTHRSAGNRNRVFENRRVEDWRPGDRLIMPRRILHARNSEKAVQFAALVRSGRFRVPNLSEWRRRDGEGIWNCRTTVQPQHIRVGKFFTLLDFMKSEATFRRGLSNIFVGGQDGHDHIEDTARMFAAVLDDVVSICGKISIIRGFETGGCNHFMQSMGRTPRGFRWDIEVEPHITFVPPEGVDLQEVASFLTTDGRTISVASAHAGHIEFGINRKFKATKRWTSSAPAAPDLFSRAGI